ncbi:unnamed protein product [Cylicocyclus nassatus]|uniref:Uncharacterized protein n=1 Tax=Cylicocyclus nassatus TaxID=53992 RepID=A0AA36M4A4_CYLNA|nr:unnamed protein product [Cylicocyclus nassatus]
MALGTAIDHVQKDMEQIRRMARTNWLMVINMPLPFGMSKCQALQQLMASLGYDKPLFDCERDLLASDLLYVNRAGLLCNMAFFVPQRHYEYFMSAPFQRKLVAHNQKLARGK